MERNCCPRSKSLRLSRLFYLVLVLTLFSTQLSSGIVVMVEAQSRNDASVVKFEEQEVVKAESLDQKTEEGTVLKELLESVYHHPKSDNDHNDDDDDGDDDDDDIQALLPFYAEDTGDDTRSDDTDEDDDGEEERVEFTAFIPKQHNSQQKSCCRRHEKVLEFDTTTTTTTDHYDLHSDTFTAPYDGLYTFSVQFQLRQRHHNDLVTDLYYRSLDLVEEVHIVTGKSQTVVCSISSRMNGRTPEYNADGKDTFSTKIGRQYNSDHQDELLLAKWDVEAEMSRVQRNVDWDKPPRLAWERNLKTGEIEGSCEGVKHLYRGQQVFVRRGSSLMDEAIDGGDDDDDDDEDVGLCDVMISGSFSGSLLTKDI